jgi:CubicO group peptidase (beta-lactamase class C family)
MHQSAERRVFLRTSIISCAALSAALATSAASAQKLDFPRVEAVADASARSLVESRAVPGMTVAVAKDGTPVFVRGYGVADVEMGVAAGPQTVYGLGSVTKQITAAAVMRLVESGKIALDDPITKYLPDYPVQGAGVTVRHLLNHTSGIQDPAVHSEVDLQKFRLDLAYSEMIDWFAKRPLSFTPGEKHEYCNMGYYLLSEIIARVAQMPYGDFVERELMQPLGLNMVYGDARRVIPHHADGYDQQNGKLVRGRYVSMHIVGGAGAFSSSAGDLVRWTYLMHDGKVVSSQSLGRMTKSTVLSSGESVGYGFGLYVGTLGDHRKFYHGGVIQNGFGSYVAHYPDDGLTIAVLTNARQGREKAEELEKALARAAFRMEIPDLPLAADDIACYEGTYLLEAGARTLELRVFGEAGQLKAQFGSGNPTRFRFQGEHTFIPMAADDYRYVFTIANGRAGSVTLHQPGRIATGKRKP